MAEKLVGKITHFFSNIGVAVVEVSGEINVGDMVHVKGATTDFEQEIDSMQVDKVNIESAKPGQLIAVKIVEKVRPNDEVFVVASE